MIVLDSTAESLQILLAGAVTTNQLVFTASYADYIASPAAFTPGSVDGVTNNATAVTLVAAPAASTQRQVKRINVYNADTAQATVTIRLNQGGTFRTMMTVVLQTGERIEYEDGEGFRVFTVTGAMKVTAVQSTVEPGYIDGLFMRWVSATAITVTAGTAYIPASGANVNVAADIPKVGLAFGANTWQHVYLFLNSGIPDVEFSTTAPAVYNGGARIKTGDPTRRYIGSVRAGAGGAVLQFLQSNSYIGYLTDSVGTGRLLAAGTATTPTVVSAASLVPVTSRIAQLNITNGTSANSMFTRSPDQPAVGGVVGPFLFMALAGAAFASVAHPISATQTLEYYFNASPPSGGGYIDVVGYLYER